MKLATQFEREEGLRLLRTWVMKRPDHRKLTEYTLPDSTLAYRVEERVHTGDQTAIRHFSLLRSFLTRDHAKLALQAIQGPLA